MVKIITVTIYAIVAIIACRYADKKTKEKNNNLQKENK